MYLFVLGVFDWPGETRMDFHPFEDEIQHNTSLPVEVFLLESCIGSKTFYKNLFKKEKRGIPVEDEIQTSRRFTPTESHLEVFWKRYCWGTFCWVFVFLKVYFKLARMKIMYRQCPD